MMPKWIIFWDAGYGKDYLVIDVEDQDAAQRRAYEEWREQAENNADYGAKPYTAEDAIDLGLEEAGE